MLSKSLIDKQYTFHINDLRKVKTYVGSDGKIHFIDATGADSVLPFSGQSIKESDLVYNTNLANYIYDNRISYSSGGYIQFGELVIVDFVIVTKKNFPDSSNAVIIAGYFPIPKYGFTTIKSLTGSAYHDFAIAANGMGECYYMTGSNETRTIRGWYIAQTSN